MVSSSDVSRPMMIACTASAARNEQTLFLTTDHERMFSLSARHWLVVGNKPFQRFLSRLECRKIASRK